MVHLRINERIGWCAPHGFEACDLNGGRGGILSEKRRRRAAQAPGGTGGRVPHFPRLEPKWLRLSFSLDLGPWRSLSTEGQAGGGKEHVISAPVTDSKAPDEGQRAGLRFEGFRASAKSAQSVKPAPSSARPRCGQGRPREGCQHLPPLPSPRTPA